MEDVQFLECQEEMNEQVLEQYTFVERVIAARTGDGQSQQEYLCKWRGLPYSECTWEDSSPRTNRFLEQIDSRNQIETIPSKSAKVYYVAVLNPTGYRTLKRRYPACKQFFSEPNSEPFIKSSNTKSSVAASVVWEALKQKRAQRGSPKAASLSRLCCQSKIPIRNRRSTSELAENAAKELESLSEYMPDISDIEARTLALRLYYMEVVEGKSTSNAQNMVSNMFLVSPSTVRRWITAWETTGEGALLDHRSTPKDEDPSLLFACPDLVFELKLDHYSNEVLLQDPDIVPIEVLDMHEARHEDPYVVAYRKEWVTKMIELKPRLPVLNVSTGKPEWPNLPPGTIPLLHGNHDEAMMYANEGNRFAWVSKDGYHLKPKGDGSTIMVSGVSVPCHGWKLSSDKQARDLSPKRACPQTHRKRLEDDDIIMSEVELDKDTFQKQVVALCSQIHTPSQPQKLYKIYKKARKERGKEDMPVKRHYLESSEQGMQMDTQRFMTPVKMDIMRHGQLKCVELLLQRGAKVVADRDGVTPLELCAQVLPMMDYLCNSSRQMMTIVLSGLSQKPFIPDPLQGLEMVWGVSGELSQLEQLCPSRGEQRLRYGGETAANQHCVLQCFERTPSVPFPDHHEPRPGTQCGEVKHPTVQSQELAVHPRPSARSRNGVGVSGELVRSPGHRGAEGLPAGPGCHVVAG
eukprot:Em0338g5a